MYQAQDYTPQEFIAPIDQFYQTPKKQGQFNFGDELMNTQESSQFMKQPVDGAPAPFSTYEDIPMRGYQSPVRGTSGIFGAMTSPVKVGLRIQEMEQNDYQPNTPQFRGPTTNLKMNLSVNHCQSAAPPRPFAEPLVEGAPENPFNVKVSSFDPEAELKPKLAPAESFARRDRKYSMNENEFSNDIFTKVNQDQCMRDVTPERKFVDFNQISSFDDYMGTNQR